ncbi:hypothetical protein C8J56DRAFT_180629 [Mycena floridula]|nr:hypothetical protein C8J56DRAFT_180629 [Mycena floridula]
MFLAPSAAATLISVLSTTGSEPLALWKLSVDSNLPSDSFVQLLNDADSIPAPAEPATLISAPTFSDCGGTQAGLLLNQTVLHIQSPTIFTTFIQCPGSSSDDLGLRNPWFHLQARNMGRQWSFEIGVVDKSRRLGILRFSTFQTRPCLKISAEKHTPPLLHLPFSFPSTSSRPLTGWSTINLYLPSFMPHFLSMATAEELEDAPVLPSGSYSHVAYLKVYATCRLRRIWFSQGGPSQKAPWEFELYGVQ